MAGTGLLSPTHEREGCVSGESNNVHLNEARRHLRPKREAWLWAGRPARWRIRSNEGERPHLLPVRNGVWGGPCLYPDGAASRVTPECEAARIVSP